MVTIIIAAMKRWVCNTIEHPFSKYIYAYIVYDFIILFNRQYKKNISDHEVLDLEAQILQGTDSENMSAYNK